MKGDFSRDSFDPAKHFARVLLQQGRVLTDADFNEQGAIQRELLRAFVVDLVGWRWRVGEGFAIGGATADDFTIGAGRCWLGGLPFENNGACRYRTQPAGPAPVDDDALGEDGDPGRAFVVYLEGWERAVSAAEDPALRDPALGGVDTSVRGQLVWRVRRLSAAAAQALAAPVAAALTARAAGGDEAGRAALRALTAAADGFAADPGSCRRADALFDLLDGARPALRVRTARHGNGEDDAGGYRGAENRLYRVEIHAPGTADAATFKWSRDNGATVLAVRGRGLGGPDSQELAIVERDPRAEAALREGDRVEVTDRRCRLNRKGAGLLRRLEAIDRAAGTLRVSGPPFVVPGTARALMWLSDRGLAPRAVLRRWDQREPLTADGAVAAVVGTAAEHWIALEDGIEIQFAPDGCYHGGDYWTVPARTAVRDVLWPVEAADGVTPRALPPRGLCRQRAALAAVRKSGRAWRVTNYRLRRG
jgi:hypothetical protein